jgi:hypothetical protein
MIRVKCNGVGIKPNIKQFSIPVVASSMLVAVWESLVRIVEDVFKNN